MTDLKKTSVKSRAEAVLFSSGHRMTLEEVSKLCRSRKEEVQQALEELQGEYEAKQSSLMLVQEGEFWKFTIRDHFIPMVRKIVTETELTRSVMETLAVIAFKYPILQSDLIKLRTNKAYDHLVELEKSGYISRQKRGRTNLIKLTDKFFKYFDLTEDNLRDKFKDFASIATEIKGKEEDVKRIKEEQKKRAEDLKKEDENIKQEIESLDDADVDYKIPVEAYGKKEEFSEEAKVIVDTEKLDNLEVYEKSKSEMKEEENQEKGANKSEETKNNPDSPEENKNQVHKKQKKKSEGIKLTPEMEKIVDQKVEKIVHPQNENQPKPPIHHEGSD
ncbi:MAG TPA: SMC-Scp complex subunit ScpB [Candidatus Nanoarchaeia archaeon]|nr:SMC-Scp complex subunit ScpB [Candidatus Nanoarchaeia archaeon]